MGTTNTADKLRSLKEELQRIHTTVETATWQLNLILTELEGEASPEEQAAERAKKKAALDKDRKDSAERMRKSRAKRGLKPNEITLPTGQVIRECPECSKEGRVIPGTGWGPGFKVRGEFVEYRPGRWSQYCYDHNEKNKEEKRTKAEWDRDANNRAFRESMEKKRVADNLELLRRRQEKEAKAAAAKNAEKTG